MISRAKSGNLFKAMKKNIYPYILLFGLYMLIATLSLV